MKNDFFGLDFGTSNSALSANINGKVKVINIDKFNADGPTMKTVIYFDDDDKKFYFGQKAVEEYIRNDAFGRYVQSIKSFLPDKTFVSTSFGRRSYSLEEVVAMILREVRIRGENEISKSIDRVVLGRPVVFSEDPELDKLAEDRLVSAARKAGFKDIYLQKEPVAAAFAYEESKGLTQEKIAIIGDLGGGTSDFSVVRIGSPKRSGNPSRESDILSVSGVHIGGDDFDFLIMWERITRHFGRFAKLKTMGSVIRGTAERRDMSPVIYRQLCEWHQIPRLNTPKTMETIRRYEYLAEESDKSLISNLENLIEDNYGYMLFRSIENAKQLLSSQSSASVEFRERNLAIGELISRIDFEAMAADKILSIKCSIEEALVSAGVKRDQVGIVILTGGTSHIPCVKKVFADMFPGVEVEHGNAFTSVAYGLGCQAF